MAHAHRSLLTALVLSGAAFGVNSRAATETALPKSSPFMSATAPAAVTAQSGTIEFAAVRTIGKQTEIDLYDTQGKKNHWIPLGGTVNGMTVVSYDARRDQVTATIGGVNKVLSLRQAKGTAAGNAAIGMQQPTMSFGTPDTSFVQRPQPLAPAVTAPAPVATTTPDPAATAPAPAPTTTPAQPAVPLTIARQEEEARMLVSDLLEIGMAQRKAYEEKQKKAADPNAAATPETPAPAPVQKPDGTPNSG